MIIKTCNFVSQRSNTSGIYFIGGFLMADYEAMCNGNHPCIERTKLYGACLENADVMEVTAEQKPVKCPMNENEGVFAFAKMAIAANAEMVMIDFSNVSSTVVPEDIYKVTNSELVKMFTDAGYVDTMSYDQRWSFAKIPYGCKYDTVNGVFIKE